MKRVLVVQTAYLGDVVLSQPLWQAIKNNWPDCEVDVLVQPAWAPLIRHDPDLHEVICFDKRGGDAGLAGLWRAAGGLRRRGYDLALCPHPSFRSAFLLWLARIPLTVGFHDSAGALFFHRRVRRDRAMHETDRVLSLLLSLGVRPPDTERAPRLPLAPFTEQEIKARFAAWGLRTGEKYVCAHPGSVWATKRWLPERFAGVLSDLADDGYRPVILGGADDIVEANITQDYARTEPINLAGRLSLEELALVLSRASLLVTNDSGPMHIAGAYGTPVVAVFGSTVPSLGYAPVGSPSRIVELDLACRPCGPHGRRRCPRDHFRCMKDLTVAQVTRAGRELLLANRNSFFPPLDA